MRTTYMPNAQTVERKWYVVDATGQTLGRLASQVAAILRGKNKAYFTPHVDCGDHVIIINADQIQMTGKKLDQKIYRKHSGYVGGLKEVTARVMMVCLNVATSISCTCKKTLSVYRHICLNVVCKKPEKKQLFYTQNKDCTINWYLYFMC